MSRSVDAIKNVDDSKETWKLAVPILDIWSVVNSKGNEHLEMVMMDSKLVDFPSRESEGSFQYGNYWKEVDDLHAVAQHFRESNRVIHAIIGHSKGGVIVLLYASKYHNVKNVVNLSGRFDLKRGIEESLGKDYLVRIRKKGFIDVKKRSGTNMHEACPQIDKQCRVLAIHGSSDKINSVQDAHKFAKIIPNHKLHIIEGANHLYKNHQDELSSVVISFIKETIDQKKGTAWL